MSLVIIFVCVFALNQFLEVGGEVGGEVSMSKRCVRLGNSHCEKKMIKGNFYDVGRKWLGMVENRNLVLWVRNSKLCLQYLEKNSIIFS